jgi:hypothetical protein
MHSILITKDHEAFFKNMLLWTLVKQFAQPNQQNMQNEKFKSCQFQAKKK